MTSTWRYLFGAFASVLILLLTLTGARAEFSGNDQEPPGARFVPGEVLVKFKDVPREKRPHILRGPELEMFVSTLPAMDRFALHEIKGRAVRAFPHLGILHVRVPISQSVPQTLKLLRESDTVEYAEPNFIRCAQQKLWPRYPGRPRTPIPRLPAPTPAPEPSPAAPLTPNDSAFPQQWGLNNSGQRVNGTSGAPDADIDAPEAWGIMTGGLPATDSSAILVVVIDTGVDYSHGDLQDNMWQNQTGDYGLNAIDYVSNPLDPMDDNGHGTHCAGIIGARGNNASGVCGVSWKARIMALKFLDWYGEGTDADAVECITYPLQNQGDSNMVISASWGGYGYSTVLHDAIAAARDAGVLFVTAAGNYGANLDYFGFYPACYADLDNIISVGASDQNDQPAYFSNYGVQSVDLFAPGVNIYSTLPGDTYEFLTGTSMACPFVSGAAALVWSKNLGADYRTVKGLILNYADQKTAFANKCVSGGRLNLYNSVVKQPNDSQNPADTQPSTLPWRRFVR
jgi:subtilisin family serine protease